MISERRRVFRGWFVLGAGGLLVLAMGCVSGAPPSTLFENSGDGPSVGVDAGARVPEVALSAAIDGGGGTADAKDSRGGECSSGLYWRGGRRHDDHEDDEDHDDHKGREEDDDGDDDENPRPRRRRRHGDDLVGGGFGPLGGARRDSWGWMDDDDDGSPLMNPGMACVSCHRRSHEGPRFAIAGTVYPTYGEPDLCFGSNGAEEPIQVHVTDADGQEQTLRVNRAGNFYGGRRLKPPFRVRVERGGKAREMVQPAPSGDCNGCHSANGRAGAPGRIVVP